MNNIGTRRQKRNSRITYPIVIAIILFSVLVLLLTTAANAQTLAVTAGNNPTIAYNSSAVREVTFYDAETSTLLPIQGAQVHFIPGNKVEVTYKKNFIRLTVGATDGTPWAETVPEWLNLPQVDPQIIYYSYMNGGRVWMKGMPSWFDYKKYDSELNGMPFVVGIETGDGWVKVKYLSE